MYSAVFQRETFVAEDGGTLGIDWLVSSAGGKPSNQKNATQPILLIFPGLSGKNSETYTINPARAAAAQGYLIGVAIFRGCADIPITSFKVDCCSAWEDVRQIVDLVREKYVLPVNQDGLTTLETRRRLYAYSCSLGSNKLGLYLSKTGSQCPLDGAFLYASPFDLVRGANYFYTVNGWLSWTIGMYLNAEILKRVPDYTLVAPSKHDANSLEKILKTNKDGIRGLDNTLYWWMYGFKSVEDYYEQSSVRPIIANIRVPTILLNAKDDLCSDWNDVPYWESKQKGSHTMVIMTERGNHACHCTGWFYLDTWQQQPILAFFNFLSQQTDNKINKLKSS